MNIEEEIKNINEYINKIENNIITENNKLLNRNDLVKKKESLQNKLKELDLRLIAINNNINAFSNKQKEVINKEKEIYNNEKKRLIDKKELIKENKLAELKELINKNAKLYINKRIILSEISMYNTMIAEFNKRKIQLRTEFIKSVKYNNSIIKKNKLDINNTNSINIKIKELEAKIAALPEKKNTIIANYNNLIDNKELINELSNLERKQQKLIKKHKQLIKYSKETTIINTSKPLLKNKLPANYKEYKKLLQNKENELLNCNKEISNNLTILEDIEHKMSDKYITNFLASENIRCEKRWQKINERYNNFILLYKDEFSKEITNLQTKKLQIENEINYINTLLNKNIITTTEEAKINNDIQLLSNIKNRLNYLKKMKNNN
jgi:hypothetical protein